MRVRHPELKQDLSRLERAVKRLMEFSRVLARYESGRTWTPGDESLDTEALREQLPVIR